MSADVIIGIEDAGPSRRARRLCFGSGDELVLPARAVTECALEVGWHGSPREVQEHCAAIMSEHARDRALRALGYRERSAAEVRGLLLDEGYPPHLVEETLAPLVDSGLVDDGRFAGLYVRTRRAAGRGDRSIAHELRCRGIADDLIVSALADEAGESEAARARKAIRGAVPRDGRERDRLLRRLVARGFSFGAARDALSSSEEEP